MQLIILLGVALAYFTYCYVNANSLEKLTSDFEAKYILAYLPAKLASNMSVNETVAWLLFFILLFLEIIIVYTIIKKQRLLQTQ